MGPRVRARASPSGRSRSRILARWWEGSLASRSCARDGLPLSPGARPGARPGDHVARAGSQGRVPMNNRTYGLAARAARGFAVLSLLASGTAMAQPPNDECAAAIALVNGLNGPFTNVAATTNGADPVMTCGGGANDVWFTYTASCAGVYAFDTCTATGVFSDTVMEVFTGGCGALVLSSCNDDMGALACPVNQFLSSGSIAMTAGQTVVVRVGGFLGFTGPFDINVTAPAVPSNDECLGASVLALGANPVSNNCATTSAGVPGACATNNR